MKTVGIICEYNPFHLGHSKQLSWVRRTVGEDCGIVCLMSGSYVQRGQPAIVDKSVRAEAALRSGANLVLELPVNVSLSSAEGFAAGGVRILSAFCDGLCFGAENADRDAFLVMAEALLSSRFRQALRTWLDQGLSFPAARAKAAEAMGLDASLLEQPNNILAVEYAKAVIAQQSGMELLVMERRGSYHATQADPENPSATAVRRQMLEGGQWSRLVGESAACLEGAGLHTLKAGERAVLAKLRTMTEEEFSKVPYGSEGLWRKLMHAAGSCATLEEIFEAVKSKRYTRTRLERMVMCAFLGLTQEDLAARAPYVRVLGFDQRGRQILRSARMTGDFPNAGEPRDGEYWQREQQWGDLYGLFAVDNPEPPGAEKRRRVCSL